jgi:hypothetical protein
MDPPRKFHRQHQRRRLGICLCASLSARPKCISYNKRVSDKRTTLAMQTRLMRAVTHKAINYLKSECNF